MYRSGFNSAFVEKRPVSVPSHSSGPVSSLPRGHHTCRLLHTSNSHTGTCLAALEGVGVGVGVGGGWGAEIVEEGARRCTEERKKGIRGGCMGGRRG